MTQREYVVVLEPEAGGKFNVLVPALPEICTFGDSAEHALQRAREAIELVLEARAETGEDIPLSDVAQVKIEHLAVSA